MNNIRTAKRIVISLLAVLSVLLLIAVLPLDDANKDVGAKKALQRISELSELSHEVDEKISLAVKEEIKEAIYYDAIKGNEKIAVVLETKGDISKEVKRVKGRISNKAVSVDKQTEFLDVEVDADKVVELAEDKDVVRVYPKVIYYPMLDESVLLIKADAFWDAGYTGSGIKVAVLDTGIDKNHPMLQGKVVAERDFSNSGNTEDRYGHGTHVAGILAGTTESGGLYSGVAPGAQLINVKVIGDDGFGDNVNIVSGISWAVDNGAKIISMSLGAPSSLDEVVESAIKQAVARGVVVVASSGNCGNTRTTTGTKTCSTNQCSAGDTKLEGNCVTSGCYEGEWQYECKNNEWVKGYCTATAPYTRACKTEACISNSDSTGTCAECVAGETKTGEECITSGCYKGLWLYKCINNRWLKDYCAATTPYTYKCGINAPYCVNGECVSTH